MKNYDCDRCGPSAQAANTIVLGSGSLQFCEHHTREYTTKLDAKGTDYAVCAGLIDDLDATDAGELVTA